MRFADIHIHALAGVDDGAATEADMRGMIDAAYADGTRVICFTPHWYPAAFSDNRRASEAAYSRAAAYAVSRGYDLKLCLGNELHYTDGCTERIAEGLCRTLNGTDNVLVDFSENEDADVIMRGVRSILNAGYRPILAHVERYTRLHSDLREARALRADGALIQIDSDSVVGKFGFGCRMRAKKCLDGHIADIVASDAHGVTRRTPQLSAAFGLTERRYSPEYARALFGDNPLRVLGIGE